MEPESPQQVHHQAESIPSPQSSQVLRTPKPPFSPPRRRSSLAFSSARRIEPRSTTITAQPNTGSTEIEGLRLTKPNISRKRALPSPGVRGGPSPAHVAQMQRLFQAAKTNMHLEMQVASSPASSIESRMNIVDTQSLRSDSRLHSSHDPDVEDTVSLRDKIWRYSTAPHLLATTNLDVREPLPSPTLPDMSNASSSHPDAENLEPLSSGFTSPMDVPGERFTEDTVSLPPLPPSSPHVLSDTSREESNNGSPDRKQVRSDTNLEQPLNQLKVTNDDESEDTTMEDSPIISYLKRRSGGSDIAGVPMCTQQSPEHRIYLSENAEAAAESAKAKRKLLRERCHPKDNDTETGDQEHAYRALTFHEAHKIPCPDPAIHHGAPVVTCPHVVAQNQIQALEYVDEGKLPRLVPRMPVDFRTGFTARPLPPQRLQPKVSRATATGSPMPFVRAGSRPTSPDSPIFFPSQPQMSSQSPLLTGHPSYRVQSPILSSPERIASGWYQPNEPFQRSDAPLYAFSTAASKVVGSNQAPDSRIRDSYKTDTLTAITMPPNRYRKNGIGANMSVRGVSRCYGRPPSRNRPATSSSTRPGSRNTIRTFEDVRFRSSPPRSLDNYRPEYSRRPRAPEQSRNFTIAEDTQIPPANFNQSHALDGGDAMKIDEDFEALAIRNALQRLSPDVMQMDKRAIKELSPNIAIYRKGVPGALATRRPRRPSYWDDDLKEIRESPAGRGGVYSPVSAQQSMRAEVENVSIMNEEVTVDENDLVGEVERAGKEFEKRLSGMPSSSTSAPPASQELTRQEEEVVTPDEYRYDGEFSG